MKVFYTLPPPPLCIALSTHTYFFSTVLSSSEGGKFKVGQSGKGLNEVTGEYDPSKAYGGRGEDSWLLLHLPNIDNSSYLV